jgi:hypothetical protein
MDAEQFTDFLDQLAEVRPDDGLVVADDPDDHAAEAAQALAELREMIETEPAPSGKRQERRRHAFAAYVVGSAQAHAMLAVAGHLKALTDAFTAAGQAVVGALPHLAAVAATLRPEGPADHQPDITDVTNPCTTVACEKAHDLDADPVHMNHEGSMWTDANRQVGLHNLAARLRAAEVKGALTEAEQTDLDAAGLKLFQRGWRAGQETGQVIAEEKIAKIKKLAEAAMVDSSSSTLGSILYFIDGRTVADGTPVEPDDTDDYTPADAAADHIVDH